jgi:anthranilate/para-aminobenzoate synthase component II
MNVLIVDNKSAHLERLKELLVEKLGNVTFSFCDARDITDDIVKHAELVVISGGWGRSIIKNPGTFNKLIDTLAKHAKPTIGICLGAEAIAAAYGATLVELPVRRVGNIRISISDAELANTLGKSDLAVYEFHKWYINQTTSPIIALATSKDGVEIIRHRELPMWGLQFHPEVRRLDNNGHKIFEYVLNELGVI